MTYFVAFGTHPKLSRAELEAVLKREHILAKVTQISANVALIETSVALPDGFLDMLGGAIKFGNVVKKKRVGTITAEDLYKILSPGEEKFYFGISTYGKYKGIKKDRLGIQLKKLIKTTKIPCRYVSSKENPLSSVVVAKNKLTTKNGAEIVLITIDNTTYIGETIAVQNFDRYSKIDYGRPAHDDKSGMLPPKVAQMMVNIAGVPKDATILDPFCGSGTVLLMAALMGYTKLIGSDLSEKAITDTRKNLNWLEPTLGILVEPKLSKIDVAHLSRETKNIDAIITEPYMGPPLKGSETHLQVKTTVSELTSLLAIAFKEYEKVLNDNGVVCMIIPSFKLTEQLYNIPLSKVIPRSFKQLGNWQYSRPNAKVIRNIILVKKR